MNIEQLKEILTQEGITLDPDWIECSYDSDNKVIHMFDDTIKRYERKFSIPFKIAYFFILLHEYGHSKQTKEEFPEEEYEVNPLPAEIDAWEKAEQEHISRWGKPDQNFYTLRDGCLEIYRVRFYS